ncbi:hypothetical protein KKG31_08195 [Patescibacteria group bacterium]|nr:hypothetical protein [Patescibacteria group bacterium]MBU1759042.1 hypothetical protein [Patescibacteria group bacterium]
MDRNRRLINLQNAFNVKENNNITGNETIFIVDDVTTTGATINELARKIKEIYPKIQIWGLVLARNNK